MSNMWGMVSCEGGYLYSGDGNYKREKINTELDFKVNYYDFKYSYVDGESKLSKTDKELIIKNKNKTVKLPLIEQGVFVSAKTFETDQTNYIVIDGKEFKKAMKLFANAVPKKHIHPYTTTVLFNVTNNGLTLYGTNGVSLGLKYNIEIKNIDYENCSFNLSIMSLLEIEESEDITITFGVQHGHGVLFNCGNIAYNIIDHTKGRGGEHWEFPMIFKKIHELGEDSNISLGDGLNDIIKDIIKYNRRNKHGHIVCHFDLSEGIIELIDQTLKLSYNIKTNSNLKFVLDLACISGLLSSGDTIIYKVKENPNGTLGLYIDSGIENFTFVIGTMHETS